MSRTQVDQFIDDEEEELCPLCVEEFDLSDKNFKPCPCGYQICQFCYNNIKTTMNGLCPACRRPYDEKSIEWKVISPEEMANYKADLAQQAKKKAAARQKEAQKREADSLSRKHLAGLRVVQKNLVYVTGLNPTTREDKLLETLRGDQYFGQYGKIIKIVVSKAKDTSHPQQSVGVYVTFAKKEDAATCIAAVDGSVNGDRVLRAQYGTTKYCSAYLRNEQCNNRNCMFLHEPGEESDSFTRQDLSSMNVISTQNPNQARPSSSVQPHPQPPPQHAPQSVAAASQPMKRQESHDGSNGSQDGPALPSHASWANKPPPAARHTPQPTSTAAASPKVASPALAPAAKPEEPKPKKAGKAKESTPPPPESPKETPEEPPAEPKRPKSYLDEILKNLSGTGLEFVFSATALKDEELQIISSFPPLFDMNGGERRKALKEKEAEERQRLEAETQALREAALAQQEQEEATGGGSMQLGGEPEERSDVVHTPQHAIQAPGQQSIGGSSLGLDQNFGLSEQMANLGLNRGLTTQQQQQLLLQQFKSANTQANSNLFQNAQAQVQPGMQGNAAGHARHTSRFTFANDGNTASANVKPVANAKLMNQQSSMMPPNSHFSQLSQHQPLGQQFYSSSVQGPPPGLKTTGTPPISGGGMFGQGHGFATSGVGYGANAMGRNAQEDAMRELLRGRGGNAGGSQLHDTGKPPGLLNFPYGPQPGAYQESGSQKQKKKGKKHRHANTSSSGGGVVDVADPSILQARLHQGGAMVGQGLYAGQGQVGEQDPLSRSVDALVGEADMQPMHMADLSYLLEQPRRSTPTVPPGLSAPVSRTGTPSSASIRPPPGIPTPHAATPHAITPAVPDLPLPTSRSGTPARKSTKESERSKATEVSTEASKTPTITKSVPGKVNSAVATPITAKAVPATKVETPKVNDKAKTKSKPFDLEHLPVTPSRPVEEVQPSPARTIAQVVASEPKASSVPPSPLRAEQVKPEAKSTMSSTKRQHPGPLQIPKKEPLGSESVVSASDAAKNPRAMSITAESSSRPGTPTGAPTGSPLKRTGPQIMRITNTPKTETPPAVSASSAPATAAIPPSVVSIRSRQPSVASLNQPGTPLSEFVSDNASMTSASMSRTNSPPPSSRVGSAPQRIKTKSQAKKERQERARQMTEVELGLKESRTPSEEPVIEGIQTRKKKEKKAKPAKAAKTAVSTPAGSRTNTPGPAEKAPIPEPQPEAPAAPAAEKEEKKKKPTATAAEIVATPAAAAAAPAPPAPPAAAAAEQQPAPTTTHTHTKPSPPAITPAAIIAKLQASGAITHEKLENMFKSFPHAGPNERAMTLADVPNRDRQYVLSDEAIRAVLERREGPHRLGGEDGRISSRVLVTPEGTILRGLSREEEDRYLELEASLRRKGSGAAGAAAGQRWNPTKEPYFDLERIVRNLNVRCVVDKSNTLRQTQAALQKAAQQAAAAAGVNTSGGGGAAGGAAAAAAAAAKLFDEAANYNDEFIMPASPTLPDDALIPPTAVENADRPSTTSNNLSASTSSTATTSIVSGGGPSANNTPAGNSLLAAPFESHYIQMNGITLSDAAAPVLGIDLGKNGLLFSGGSITGGPGGPKGVAAATAAAAAKSGGPVLAVHEIEKELNLEKQRANEYTKKLNAAIKRNRKVVGAASH
ncbi:Rna recognition domain-containing protein [Lasiodiplodia theobromae]|uniref:Rna recognition domain-containing protein n=1 Tax=Lasiodiplodia theobromae TaxID=45133 RepID=UPI0015C34948|nr:Rna recognition domain-containing protein [Lasiodiplodia theobromae]KAF4543179.1 Rna recognition domain-containing protein [Lasiodiplodia theobromae]